jgi:hypothetical protein
MQRYFLEKGVFVRRSLSYGELYFDEKFVCGAGISHAYKLENEIAIFPRIIVDESFIAAYRELGELDLTTTEALCLDFDGFYFLDYLRTLENGINMTPVGKETESLDESIKMKRTDFFQVHKEQIETNLANNKNPRVLQKYQWCKNYHNQVCDENPKLEQFKILS